MRHNRFQPSVKVSDLKAEPSKRTVDFLAKVLEDPDVGFTWAGGSDQDRLRFGTHREAQRLEG
jgi:hypothetical protein